jgi:hypothetical protein
MEVHMIWSSIMKYSKRLASSRLASRRMALGDLAEAQIN